MEKQNIRKLSAIMFTDIVGYSKMMGADENRAMEFLKVQDQIIRSEVEARQGKVIKTIGDAFLVDFDSAVNAVGAAVSIQKRMTNYNKNIQEENRTYIRIGIHLGDVVISDNDIFGDGVNIASRIQPIAEPGGICISHDVLNQVKNKIDIRTISLGPQELKNISEKLEIYSIISDEITDSTQTIKTKRIQRKNQDIDKFWTGCGWGAYNLLPIVGTIISLVKISERLFQQRPILYASLFFITFLIPGVNIIPIIIFLYLVYNRIGGRFCLGYVTGALIPFALIFVLLLGVILPVLLLFSDSIKTEILRQNTPATFHAVEITDMRSDPSVSFTRLNDGSIIVNNLNSPRAEYILTARTSTNEITGFRLETLADNNLPNHGPGHSTTGNFILSEFGIRQIGNKSDSVYATIEIDTAIADYSQTSQDVSTEAWPIWEAIDGRLKTGWAIYPKTGQDHWAIFKLRKPLNISGPTDFSFSIQQQYGDKSTIGRFRLMAITGNPLK